MATFKISVEIELDADSPLEAAKILKQWMKEDDDFQYYVQDENKNIFSVDLNEDDEDAVLQFDPSDYISIIEK